MSDPVRAIANRIKRRCDPLARMTLRHGESDAWHSLLFDGGRHRIELGVSGDRIDEALDALREEIGVDDFIIPGHLVAEIRVTEVDRGVDEVLVRLDALTIESSTRRGS